MTVENVDLARARAAFRARRVRDQAFGNVRALFSEPAWDMLLQLFIWREEHRVARADELTAAAAAPVSTAIRWLDVLISEGLVDRLRAANQGDTVRLTDRAVALVRASLS